MSLRSAAIEQYQFGAESTPGTGVSADKRYLSITKLNLKAVEPKSRYRGSGSEVPNGESQEKVHSEFDGEGPICYLTLPLILNGLLSSQASSPYSYTPNAFGVDTIKTYTIEKGSAAGAEKAYYCVFKSARLRFTKRDASINFTGFGRKLQTGATLSATPTKVACVPVDPKKVQFLIGDDEAGLAAVNWQELELNIGDRWAPHFEGNSSQESFEEHNKQTNDHTLRATITLSAAAVADLVTASRGKALRCVRIKATSDLEVAEGEPYDLEITAMAFVDMPDTSGETDGVVTAQVTFTFTYDSTFAGFLKVTVTNAPSA